MFFSPKFRAYAYCKTFSAPSFLHVATRRISKTQTVGTREEYFSEKTSYRQKRDCIAVTRFCYRIALFVSTALNTDFPVQAETPQTSVQHTQSVSKLYKIPKHIFCKSKFFQICFEPNESVNFQSISRNIL